MAAVQTAPEILRLHAHTAAELMAPNPISLRAEATAAEAAQWFADKGVSAAPVIDESGRPIGVLSRSDLLVHRTESGAVPGYFAEPAAEAAAGRPADGATVADLMTPAVFAVAPDAPASRVVSDMVGLHVHRLFVVDDAGVLVGVITTMDLLRHLKA